MIINIMGCRYETLKAVLVGFAKTGVALVGFNGEKFFPADSPDDPALFYFVPNLVKFFDISLDQAIYFFFYSMIFLSFFLAVIGFFLLSKSWLFRIISIGATCVFWFLALRETTDVYLMNAIIVFAVIPIAVYFFRQNRFSPLFLLFSFFSGIFIGFAHYTRAFSSLSVLLFLVLGFFFYFSVSWQKKFLLCAVLFAGISIPVLHFHLLFNKQKTFLGPEVADLDNGHHLYHTFYGGFGFLDNKFGIKYDDSVIVQKIHERYPDVIYPTKKYNAAAKIEIFRLVRENFYFVRDTIFAKLGVIFYFLLFFANIGLVAAFFYRKPWILELMFWVGIAFGAVPGIIAIPIRAYLLGFCAFATVYGLISIEYALCQGAVQDILIFFKLKKKGSKK